MLDWAGYDLSMQFDVLRRVADTIRTAWIGGVEGRDDPPDVPVGVESHAVAMPDLTLADGAHLALLYERVDGVNGPAPCEPSVEGTKDGLSLATAAPA